MTVTKQQQLEWLAKEFDMWPNFDGVPIRMSSVATGEVNYGLGGVSHHIRMEEWQKERDKMSSKPEIDNSWHELGELPPVGCECEWVDESGVDGVDGVVYPQLGDVVTIHAHADTPGGYTIAIFTWARGSGLGVAASRMQEAFRPLRTEREKAIDAACKAIGDVMGGRLIIERIYDAGLLK